MTRDHDVVSLGLEGGTAKASVWKNIQIAQQPVALPHSTVT